jgi:hypothetical protein
LKLGTRSVDAGGFAVRDHTGLSKTTTGKSARFRTTRVCARRAAFVRFTGDIDPARSTTTGAPSLPVGITAVTGISGLTRSVDFGFSASATREPNRPKSQ